MLEYRRAGALTAWGTAYLLGSVSLDEADAAVVGRDAAHRVVGVPAEPDPVPVSLALGRLRARGVTALRLVLPEAGDPTGLPGPATLTARALAAGAVVVTIAPSDVASYALLARGTSSDGPARGDAVLWEVVPVERSVPPGGLPTLSEADRALTEAMSGATSELAALDVARGRDDVAPRLRALDRDLRDIELPRTLPARAQRLVATATRLLGVLDIAVETDGAAVTATEARRRADALRPLRTAARYALCAAYSAAAEDGPATRAR